MNKKNIFDYDNNGFNRQIYIKMEAFPVEIQDIIFNKLSPTDRVRIERVSKTWRSLVRQNGWFNPAIELNSLCVRNLHRLQRIGFGSRVRQLSIEIDWWEDFKNDNLNIWYKLSSEELASRNEYFPQEEIVQFFRISAFPNLVHLRIDDADTAVMMKSKMFPQFAELTALKTLSLGCFSDSYYGFDFQILSLDLLIFEHKTITFGEEDLTLSHLCSLIQPPLKSVWLDGGHVGCDKMLAYPFYKWFLDVCHLALGRLHLTQQMIRPICQLKNRLKHLGIKLPICYHAKQLDPNECAHVDSSILNLGHFSDIFSNISSSLISLELDRIGPKEIALVIYHCKLLQHLAFSFSAKKEFSHMNVAEMMHSMIKLPTELVHLRSLDFLLNSLQVMNKKPMSLLVEEMLGPIMRKLAHKGQIEYLSVKMYNWEEGEKERKEILLSDDVLLEFVRHCNNLRYLDHKFKDQISGKQLTEILDEKLAKGERSLASNNWLLLPRQNHQFSHLLVAFCEQKPRNHVFCAIRAQGLTSVPPDYFFLTPLLHDKCEAGNKDGDQEDEEAANNQ